MSWDDDLKIQFLLGLPWNIYAETSVDGERLLRVRELPSVIGSGDTDDEIERDFWDSLEATLRSYLHFGDELPLPALPGIELPWKQAATASAPPRQAYRAEEQRVDQPDTAALERWKPNDLVEA